MSLSRPRSPLYDRLRRDRFFQFGLALVVLVLLAAIFAPLLAPHDPYSGDLRNAYLQHPGAHYLLGFSWQLAVLLGAVCSPTDAAAVFSVLRVVPLPKRITGTRRVRAPGARRASA